MFNQSDLTNQFTVFVKFYTYNQCLVLVNQCHSFIISSGFRDYSWLRLGIGVWIWV